MTASYEDFKKLTLKTARIINVREHPDADRLYVLEIDTGSEHKEIVAGIRPYYKPDELVGRDIVIIDNLQPAVIRGVESKGMLLAVSDGDKVRLISPDAQAAPGSTIK